MSDTLQNPITLMQDKQRTAQNMSLALADLPVVFQGLGDTLRKAEMAIERLRAENKERWRPCADELPTEADRYQCTFRPLNGERYVQDDYFDGSRFVHHDLIEAWRPRPEPYSPPEEERKKGNGEVCCKCGMVIKSYVYSLCEDGKESPPHCGPCFSRKIEKEARS